MVTNQPRSASGPGYSYSTFNTAWSNTTDPTYSHYVSNNAAVSISRGGYGDVDRNSTMVGQRWVKSFYYAATAPTDVRPTNATFAHRFSLQGDLKVYCPTPADPNTSPLAVANVTFIVDGLDATGQGLVDGGQNELRALKDGRIVNRLGQPAVSPRPITNTLVFYKKISNMPAVGDQAVEIGLECQALGDGRLIPGGTTATAQSGFTSGGNRITSTYFAYQR